MTKTEVAEFLGVSERAIERYAKSGKLHPTLMQRAIGGTVNVFDRAEVERLKLAMASPLTAVVGRGDRSARERPEATPTPPDDTTTTALVRRPSRAVEATPIVPLGQRLLLTYAEASALSGAGVTYIEEAVAAGTLAAHRLGHRGAWVIRRRDLEAWIENL